MAKRSISLPADARWMRFAQESLHRYGKMVGFSEKLEEMCASSVMEACEELVSKAESVGITDPIDLLLDYKGETIVVNIGYNGRIPLNPHETENYEVPDEATSVDEIDLDSLWLHMIKRRMDRVRFKVEGRRHVLEMVKYRREEGKEKQAWIMEVKPELDKHVILHLDESGGENPPSTLQSPGAGVLKLGPSETFLVRNMDGKTSFHKLYMSHIDALGLTSPNVLVGLYEQLEIMGMLYDPQQKVARSRLRIWGKRLLNPDFTISNADAVVTAVHKKMRFLYSPLGVIALCLLGLSGIIPLWLHHSRFLDVIVQLEETLLGTPIMILPLYLLTLLHVSLHELGHGVTCKHFGGNVPRLGVMFYLASFIFYCDTTAAWNFPEKRQRILVSLGGPLVTFAILGVGLWCSNTFVNTGSIWESVFMAFNLFSFFGLVMNFNPLIKMDAYYMLLDYTGIPNLRERSFKFLERKTLGWLGVGSEKHTKVTIREQKIFWRYGTLGAMMTLIFVFIPVARLHHILSVDSVTSGRLILSLLIGVLLVVRLGNLTYSKIKSVRYREYKLQ